MGDNRSEPLHLGSRDGNSPDGAAYTKRRDDRGLWWVIPVDHPSYRVTIERPALRLTPLGEQLAAVSSDGSTRPNVNHRADELAGQVVQSLLDARAVIDDLTVRLVSEKDAHRQTAHLLHEQMHALARDLDEVRNAHRLDVMELVGAEMREMGTKAEYERAAEEVERLRVKVMQRRRPWWRKLIGRRLGESAQRG